MSEPRFLIDECLSSQLAHRLRERGLDAVAVRDRAKLGQTDSAILEFALAEDRIIVTQNAGDFRRLIGSVKLHPGLIILSARSIERSWDQLSRAVEHANGSSNPDIATWMINRVIEVDGERATNYELPPARFSLVETQAAVDSSLSPHSDDARLEADVSPIIALEYFPEVVDGLWRLFLRSRAHRR